MSLADADRPRPAAAAPCREERQSSCGAWKSRKVPSRELRGREGGVGRRVGRAAAGAQGAGSGGGLGDVYCERGEERALHGGEGGEGCVRSRARWARGGGWARQGGRDCAWDGHSSERRRLRGTPDRGRADGARAGGGRAASLDRSIGARRARRDGGVTAARAWSWWAARLGPEASPHGARPRRPLRPHASLRAPPRSNPIRLPHSPPLLSPPRAHKVRTSPFPSPRRARTALPISSTAAPSAPPRCAITSANHHHSAPTTPTAARFEPASGRLRRLAQRPAGAEPAGTTPLHVSAPQAHLTCAPPVLLLPVQVDRCPGAHGTAGTAGCGGPLRASASHLAPCARPRACWASWAL